MISFERLSTKFVNGIITKLPHPSNVKVNNIVELAKVDTINVNPQGNGKI